MFVSLLNVLWTTNESLIPGAVLLRWPHEPQPLRGESTASLVDRSLALEEVAPSVLEAPPG